MTKLSGPRRSWWHAGRTFTAAEVVADGVIHSIGIVAAITAGAILLAFTAFKVPAQEVTGISLYVGTLVVVLSISLAYNLWPMSPMKRLLARFDQAAIFLFIAGTYTPFLVLISDTTTGKVMLGVVWSAALCGVALKLIIPHTFGHFAILLYLAIGASGVVVLQSLAQVIPPLSIWLLGAGGVIYTIGIIFHLWEKLRFQTALWHLFVVVAATLHFGAVLEVMVFDRY